MQTSAQHSKSLPHLVIVVGGFGDLSAAKEVAGKPLRVTLIDRINHHLFQHPLYERTLNHSVPAGQPLIATAARHYVPGYDHSVPSRR
jgi:NADH dehydrogenase, FAD-containing subunit